ncbi:hypothetical protein Tco_0716937 [Tanacetum coccineum]
MLSARAALHVSVLTLSFNLSCGPPIWGTDGPRSSDEWADVATKACGDSDRGCGTGKRFQGSGGSGCTDDVEFSGWEFEGEVPANRSLTSSKIIFSCLPFDKGKGNCGVALNYPCAHRNMVDMP